MKKTCWTVFLSVILAGVLCFGGCGAGESHAESGSTAAAGTTAPGSTAAAQTTALETTKNADLFAHYDTYGGGVANWVDDVYAGFAKCNEGTTGAAYLKAAGYRIDSGEMGVSALRLRGWMGFNQAVEKIGYSIDGGKAVYVTNEESTTEAAVKTVAGQYATRYSITVPVASLAKGTHTVNAVVRLKDGTELLLDGAQKDAELRDNLPYAGNILTTITYVVNKAYDPDAVSVAERILKEAKWVADYVRTHGFRYGNAPINPAVNCDAKLVSCDRLVCWALYRAGFADQPQANGLVVYDAGGTKDLTKFCISHGFTRINNVKDLQPGDIVFETRGGSYPGHTFIFEGWAPGQEGKFCSRYDGGSDQKIQAVQPMTDWNDNLSTFMYAMRPGN